MTCDSLAVIALTAQAAHLQQRYFLFPTNHTGRHSGAATPREAHILVQHIAIAHKKPGCDCVQADARVHAGLDSQSVQSAEASSANEKRVCWFGYMTPSENQGHEY